MRRYANAFISVLLVLSTGAFAQSDSFAGRTAIADFPATRSGTTVGATAETGEPDHALEPATHSVWWTWTSTVSGTVEINTHGSGFDTVLAVYTGAALASLTEVASNDESPQEFGSSRVRFSAAAGTVYQIALDGWQGEAGDYVLNLLTAPDPPINDEFATPTLISGAAPQTANGTNLGAGSEPDEVELGTGSTVWWRWTCPAGQGGTYQLTTEGSAINTVLAVYTGTALNNLARRALNDDIDFGSTNLASQIRFNAIANTPYRFAVDGGFGGENEGAITLNLTRITPAILSPANDNLASAAVLSGGSGTVNGSNILASGQAGEPDHEFNTTSASVWYSWTPPSVPGTAELQLSFTNGVEGVVSVYTGSSMAALTRLDTLVFSTFTNGLQRARFTPPAGQNLRIAVDGVFGGQAPFELTYRHPLPQPPFNDNFDQAHPLTGLPVSADFTNNYATTEANDNDLVLQPMGSTVWFTWTSATLMTARISVRTADIHPAILVSTGDVATNLTFVTAGQGEADFNTEPGTTYRIMVGSLTAEEGAFTLGIEEAPALRPINDPFTNAWYLGVGDTPEMNGSLRNATLEAVEVTNGVTRSVWYTWDARYDGPAEALLRVRDAGVRTQVNVYSLDPATNLLEVASGSATNAVRVAFNAEWNARYAVRVADARPEGMPSDFLISVTNGFPVTGFEISDFQSDPKGIMQVEWPAVRGVEYNIYAGDGPIATNNLLIRSIVATQNVMRAFWNAPPPTNLYDRIFIEAAEPAGGIEPGLP